MTERKVEKDVQQLSEIDSIRVNPTRYIGGTNIAEYKEHLIFDGKAHECKIGAIPSLLKCFDEVLVNAIDQHTKHPTSPFRIRQSLQRSPYPRFPRR